MRVLFLVAAIAGLVSASPQRPHLHKKAPCPATQPGCLSRKDVSLGKRTSPHAIKRFELSVRSADGPQITKVMEAPGTYTVDSTTVVVPSGVSVTVPALVGGVSTSTVLGPGTYAAPSSVVTVTESNYVYAYPLTEAGTPAATSESQSLPDGHTVKASTTLSKLAARQPTVERSLNSQLGAPVGDKWGMTYTPYSNAGGCKSEQEVASDLARIYAKGFGTIRLYGTDCATLESVGAAAEKHGLRLLVGIFIDADGISKARKQLEQIAAWAKFDLVDLVIVGNEALFNEYVSASELASFIQEVRTTLRSKGYQGPVTTTEPLNKMLEHGSLLCPVVDVAAANLHPFFNADVSPEKAGKFVKDQLSILSKTCNGMPSYNLESGWPSDGKNNGKATVSKQSQSIALSSIAAECGSRTIFFSFEDDLWKHPGSLEVEQHFGSLDQF